MYKGKKIVQDRVVAYFGIRNEQANSTVEEQVKSCGTKHLYSEMEMKSHHGTSILIRRRVAAGPGGRSVSLRRRSLFTLANIRAPFPAAAAPRTQGETAPCTLR